MGDGALDLGIAPCADSLLLVRCDVAGNRFPPGAEEFLSAFAETAGKVMMTDAIGGVALHAVAGGGEIAAAFDRVAQVAFQRRLVGARKDFGWQRRFVDRRRHLIVHGREDKVIPVANSYKLMELIDNADLAVFSHCGHWSMIERTADFNRLVTDFLAG